MLISCTAISGIPCERVCTFRLPIETMKQHIGHNLEQLERAKLVSSQDNYQSLINSIVQVKFDLHRERSKLFSALN